MRIEVLCFATARDAVGASRLELEIEEGSTVASTLAVLAARHPGLGPGLASLRCAVNEEFVAAETRLRPGDILALIPPVSGG